MAVRWTDVCLREKYGRNHSNHRQQSSLNESKTKTKKTKTENMKTQKLKWAVAALVCGGLFSLTPNASAVLFRLPLASNAVQHYYFDHSGPGYISDWKCQTETYDGHVGTDFDAPRYTAIYCGAVGTLAAKQDGWGDGSLGTDPSHANYVIVNHASGMRTLYWHMQLNTVTTKGVGSSIACGEQIGQVGNSGMTSGPHLHFEPQLNNVPDDPYSGACGGPTSWWVNQNGGNPVTTCEGITKGARDVDNSSAGFSVTGTWSAGSSATDKYGGDYRYHSTAAVSAPAQWATTLNGTATWNVKAWWPQGSNRSTTAPYVVQHAAGTTTINVNQQINGGKWNLLGSWNMGGAVTVKLSCWTGTGYIVVADAVRWD
jgi:murein DD-endopeptidase MepM/ murein hydrolase activator NlpD